VGHTVLIAALVIMGPFLLVSGAADLVRRRRFDAGALRATGTVTACERRPGIESARPTYRLRVRFTTPTGEDVEFGDDSTGPYAVGAPVPVRFTPRPPWPARVAGAGSGSTLRAYGLLIGGGLATIGLVAVLIA
jgi:hypothetical protein